LKVAALMERLAHEPHTRLRDFCSPQHTDSALYPVISQMERAASFAHEDTPQQKLDKLDALLAQTFTPQQHAALFAEMLSLPDDGRYPTLELTPQQRREQTLEALTAQVAVLARSNPVLMIFEDAHWIDPSSLEVIGRTVDRLKTLRLLLIVTYRPEFDPPWIGRPYVTTLNLNRLGEREIASMIERVAGNKSLSQSIRQDIIERTDGIPLFVEEMTKAVLEAQGEGAADSTISTIPSPSVGVPASLHASLMARLDRLGPAKEVAQIGAAIGREFSHALLQAVVRKPEPELRSALDRLLAAGLLFRQGVPPHATYLFKHALVQDAAYGTLLREPRRSLHARIAETLEGHFQDTVGNQPELLARHCTEAGLSEKAAHFWGYAGMRSLERSALVEAAEHLTRGLAQIAMLPGNPALRREEIKLQVALISSLTHIKGYAAPETKTAVERAKLLIERAEAVGEAPEDPLLLFSVLYGSWVANVAAFNGDLVLDLAAQCLALAEKRGTTVPLMIGHRLMGTSLFFIADFARGRAHLDRAIALYDPAEHRVLATHLGHDIRAAALCLRSWVMWVLGYPQAALADANRSLKDARELGQAATLMFSLTITAVANILRGEFTAANLSANELVAVAEEKGAALFEAFGKILRGSACALDGRAAEAVRILSSGLDASQSTGAAWLMPLFLSHLAWAYSETNQFENARRYIAQAITTLQTTKETWFEAEATRVAGEIALMSPEPHAMKAQEYFDRALTVAQQQQAKSWELRAAMSLARLWRDQGKPQQARDLLAPVYGWFTEGFDTRDLKEAKALLEELAA
jgi:predicted ATPase